MLKHILTLVWNKKRSNFLMLLEVFFAFLILFAIFTFAINYLRIYTVPLGFDTENITMVHLSIPEEIDSTERVEIFRQLRQELEVYPEIEKTSFQTSITPFSGSIWSMSHLDNGFLIKTALYGADEQFAETMGLKIVEGRWYQASDLNAKYPPIVINKQLKETYFKDRPVIDSILVLEDESRIVGVVEYFKYQGQFADDIPTSFPLLPLGDEEMGTILIRLRPGTPPEFEEKINTTVAAVTNRRDFVIQSIDALRKRRARITWIPLIGGLAISGFLIINIALGLFGVLYYNISKRRAEIGLRRAIGASQGEVRQQFTLEIFLVALLGMLVAMVLAVQFPLLEVIDIPAQNFYLSIGLTALVISIVVLLCALGPSHQAAQVHPATALHEE